MTDRLKLARPVRPVPAAAQDPARGGLGLDFDRVPEHLGEVGRAAWAHVAATLAPDPVYLRELDRHALISYCESLELRDVARRELLADGMIVAGRSSQDRGRQVRNPMFQVWRDADTRVERWSVQLGLTRLGRHRLGQVVDREDDADNPFTSPETGA